MVKKKSKVYIKNGIFIVYFITLIYRHLKGDFRITENNNAFIDLTVMYMI